MSEKDKTTPSFNFNKNPPTVGEKPWWSMDIEID